ncbi:hypothetical protein B0T19DRAFT_436965 [Cercophora scortea]|uniref:Uncharacterized protein n=1 Tax=Cercophora scortea TaxID=314031 RepID=A0AAE0MKT9_9PEZI|nr:hypothetical protein B0T19DRAFT_436965 [Cercophora scortea]
MKLLGRLYLGVILAPLGSCAPIPPDMEYYAEPVVSHVPPYPPTMVPGPRPKHALPETIPDWPDLEESASSSSSSQVPIDNRPFTPSAEVEPSAVLAYPHPLETGYLLSLSKHRKSEFRPDPASMSKWQDGNGHGDAEDSLSIAEMDVTVAIPTTQRLGGVPPCHPYARLSREHNDMLVILLVAAFLLVVVAVETWGSLSRSMRRAFPRQGAIRLGDDEDVSRGAKLPPLSIQSSSGIYLEREPATWVAPISTTVSDEKENIP